MMKVVLLMALAMLATVALSDTTSRVVTYPTYPGSQATTTVRVFQFDEDDLCNSVGVNTGCSGCELGTKNLCRASRAL